MAQPKGKQLSASYDTSTNLRSTPGYDALNRMTSVLYRNQDCTYNSLMQWTYDRYGNRWSQTATGARASLAQPSVSFDASTNHLSGATYDAAGNMIQDLAGNTYTYDAEGNLVSSSGGTVQSIYDALNHRVAYQSGGSATLYTFNPAGQRSAAYDASENLLQNQIYWAGTPVAFIKGGVLEYQFQNWVGTETFNVSSEQASEYISEPFGDGFTLTSGTDDDPYHFAGLDGDADGTMHAQFRNYQPTTAQWLSPDPYDGSYSSWNPQSFNRYAYVQNNPLAYVDPSGLNYVSSNGCWSFGYYYWGPNVGDTGQILAGVDTYCFAPTTAVGVVTGSASSSSGAAGGGGGAGGGSAGAPSKPAWDANLPNCWAVGGKAVLNAVGDTLGPVTDVPGLIKAGVDEATNVGIRNAIYNATLYSLTTINTKGGVGLLSPWKSSTYRAMVADTATFADIATGASLLYFDYNLVKQIVNEIKNPTPCR